MEANQFNNHKNKHSNKQISSSSDRNRDKILFWPAIIRLVVLLIVHNTEKEFFKKDLLSLKL